MPGFQTPPTPAFDRIAPVYDLLAGLVYGDAQKKAQSHFLSLLPQGASILVLGGGTGWLLPPLLRQCHPARVLYLEASRAMLQKARHRVRHLPEKDCLEFRQGTEQDLHPEETFHVIITPFVLDLFTPPEASNMVHHLDQALEPQGLWLHTDFHLASGTAHQVWQKPLLWGMYRFFGLVSGISAQRLPPLDQIFRQADYILKQEAFFYRHFIKTQVWQKQ